MPRRSLGENPNEQIATMIHGWRLVRISAWLGCSRTFRTNAKPPVRRSRIKIHDVEVIVWKVRRHLKVIAEPMHLSDAPIHYHSGGTSVANPWIIHSSKALRNYEHYLHYQQYLEHYWHYLHYFEHLQYLEHDLRYLGHSIHYTHNSVQIEILTKLADTHGCHGYLEQKTYKSDEGTGLPWNPKLFCTTIF